MKAFTLLDRLHLGRTAVAALLPGVVLATTFAAYAQQQPADKSAEVYMKLCSSCHDSERILASRRTRTQWEEVIEKMVERGAEGTADEFAAVEEYLLRHSGQVNVNRAVGKDIAAVLGVSQKDADTIVSYRKANGEYADFDALCKVPGVDIEKLKQGRDAISF